MQSTFRQLLAVATFVVPTIAIGVQSASAEDLQFTLNNSTKSPLVKFYVEVGSANHWGENILNGSAAPGESATVTIADGKSTCTYGIKGVFADGEVVVEENINLCELGSYTYK